MIPATSLSLALAGAVLPQLTTISNPAGRILLPTSHCAQVTLSFTSLQLLLIADISCLLSSSKLCSSLCPLTSLFLPSDQHLFPNFPNPAPNTSINFWNTHSIAFSAHQPLPPGRMFPFNICISTLQIFLSAEFLISLKRKYVLVLLKSLMWAGVDSLLFETHPSPSCWFTFSQSSCIAVKYYLYR